MVRPLLLPILFLLGCHAAARASGPTGDAFPPGAPPMPACNAPREGVVACLARKACLCRFERGGSMTGRPDRFGWDCGALRPACGPAPAGTPPPFAEMPVFPQVTLPETGGAAGPGWGPPRGTGP